MYCDTSLAFTVVSWKVLPSKTTVDICPDCQMLVILSKAGIQESITVPLDARASASLGSS
jgi:hypothetical protein